MPFYIRPMTAIFCCPCAIRAGFSRSITTTVKEPATFSGILAGQGDFTLLGGTDPTDWFYA